MSLFRFSAREIRDKTLNLDIDPIETAEVFVNTAVSNRERLNAFISFTPDLAIESAKRVRELLGRKGKVGPLAGVPIAIKDNMCLRGYPTTCGSRILSEFMSPYSATVVDCLIDAGAIIIGKTNMDEFAMGSTNETSWFGPCRNPIDLDYSPGGSSGGSAASVAAMECPLALGSDTGGSIRQPAALCGMVGLKPTYGTVSRYGLVAYASSLDQIGPIARNVEDAALLFEAICGRDERDSMSVDYSFRYDPSLPNDLRDVTVGVPREYIEGADSDVAGEFDRTLDVLGALGCDMRDIELPDVREVVAAYYIIAMAEASSNLARYDGVRYGHRVADAATLDEMYNGSRSEGFGAEVKRRIMLGTYVLSAGYYDKYYQRARDMRDSVTARVGQLFKQMDIIALPTSPKSGIRLGEIQDPISMYHADIYTVLVNFIGTCAISIPCGRGENGMPVGFQLVGRPFDENSILRVATRLEAELGYQNCVERADE